MVRSSLSRRAALASLAAFPFAVRAQEATPAPQITIPVPPPMIAPAIQTQPRPAAASVTAIDKTKLYFLFFDQAIDVNSMRALRRQLATLVEAGVSQITIVIDSPGGQIDPMLMTYSFIRALPATINTHGQGFVASAATVLFLAGQQRSADRTARFLFHPSVTTVIGAMTDEQMHDRLTQVNTVQDMIASIYQDRSKLTEAQTHQFARSEIIFTAEQARDAGIVDTVADLKLPGENTARMLFLD